MLKKKTYSKSAFLTGVSCLLKVAALSFCFSGSVAIGADLSTTPSDAIDTLDSPKFKCIAAFNEVANSSNQRGVIPFSPLICPKDATVQIAYRFLPHVMDMGADVLNLKYKDEIREYYKLSKFNDSHVKKFEDVVSVVRAIALWFISIILSLQVLAAGVKTLQDGHLGGKSWGNFGVTTGLCLGVIFLLPIGHHVYIGELMLVLMFYCGLGFCNIGISTVLYSMGHGADQFNVLGDEALSGSLLAYNAPVTRDVSDGDSRGAGQIGDRVGGMHAVRYIETGMCINQTAKVVGVNYIGSSHGFFSSGRVNGLLGLNPTPSFLDDSTSTMVEISRRDGGATLQYGVNVDTTGVGAQQGVGSGLCATEQVSVPSLYFKTNNKFNGIYTDDVKTLLNAAISGSVNILVNTDDSGTRGELLAPLLTAKYMTVQALVLSKIKSYNTNSSDIITNEETVSALHSLSDYFFKKIIYEIEVGGDGTGTTISNDSRLYYGKVFGLVDAINNGVGGGNCLEDYEGYKTTKSTIGDLNDGSIPRGDINLKCAMVGNNGFKMSFLADSDDYQSYTNSISRLMSDPNLKNQIKINYDKLDGYLTNIYVGLYVSRKKVESDVGTHINQSFNNSMGTISASAYQVIREIREGGFPEFGMQFLNLFSETESTYYVDRHHIESMLPIFNSMYSSRSGFVSSLVSVQSDNVYTPSKVMMPPAFYKVINGSVYATSSDIENAILSKMGSSDTGGDGGNTTNLGAGMIGSESILSETDAANLSWKKAKEALIGLIPIVSIPSSVLTEYTTGSAASAVTATYASSSDIKYALQDLCRGGGSLNRGRGDNSFFAKHVCDRYNRHPLTYYQDMGIDLIENVGVISLAYIGLRIGSTSSSKAFHGMNNKIKAMLKKNESGRLAGDELNTLGVVTEDIAKVSDLSKGVRDGVSAIAKKLSGLYVYVTLLLLILGILFGLVLPILPYLVFSLAWLNFVSMFLQTIAVCMLLFSALVLFGDNDHSSVLSKKGLVNAFINLTFRPIACIIAFSLGWSMAYSALQAMDSISIMIINNYSPTMNISDTHSADILFTMLIIGVAQFAVIKWVFSTAMSLPNFIIKRMGGDTVDSGDGFLKTALGSKLFIATALARRDNGKSMRVDVGGDREKLRNTRDRVDDFSDYVSYRGEAALDKLKKMLEKIGKNPDDPK